MTYLLTAIGLSPGGSITAHIYAQTMHRTTQIATDLEECGPCPFFANFTVAFALQLRNEHGKHSVRVQNTYYKNIRTLQNLQTRARTHTHTHAHTHTPPLTHAHTHTHTHTYAQWSTEGGLGCSTPPPPKFRRPSKIVPNLTRLWKLLKIAEFRTPTPQDVRKKGSKIVKPPRFAIVLL